MSDPAFRPLLAALTPAVADSLWVVDEQLDETLLALLRPQPNLRVLTNRCDVFRDLQRRGFDIALSDFDFDSWPEGSLTRIIYRVSKEKAVVHHVINAAMTRLGVGGELWLSGAKSEGIKTYVDKAEHYARGGVRVERHGPVQLGVIARADALGAPSLSALSLGALSLGGKLDDQNYSLLREIDLSEKTFGETLRVWTKPGIYGWQKIDTGSALLAQCLSQAEPPPTSVLDLGCGYGYLSVHIAQQWPTATLTATDNNVAAVAACEKNMALYSDRAEVLLDDCAESIEKKFDAVICNPPFHQGFSVEGDLTTQFLQSARARLLKNGRALFVVNQFIPLERKAESLFSAVFEIRREHGFKVLVLQA